MINVTLAVRVYGIFLRLSPAPFRTAFGTEMVSAYRSVCEERQDAGRIGLGFFLSILGLAVRDITFLIQYIVIALLIVTPIAYTPDMIPAQIKPLLYLNPLYYYVSANQHLILVNELPPVFEMVVGTTLSLTMFFLGLWVFKRARMAMMDLL